MEKWFRTGLFMEDGVTEITVCARGTVQAEQFLKNGWTPVEKAEGQPEAKGRARQLRGRKT